MNERIYCILLLCTVFLLRSLSTKRTAYIAAEHPTLTYYNRRYLANVSLSSRRYSRRDPMYYIQMVGELLVPLDNNVSVHLYAADYPGNGHIITEQHFKWCNLICKDKIFGFLLRRFLPSTCPTPKGIYKAENLTTAGLSIPFIEHLPFRKARVYINCTIFREKLIESNVDVEIKRMKS